MAQQTADWFLSRLYGSHHVDGYGSGVYEVDSTVREYNLGRNSMYEIQFLHSDGYFGIIDGYESIASSNSDKNRNAESSITVDNGRYVTAGTTLTVTTHTNRHVLSVMATSGSNMEVRVIKKEPGKSLKDSDNNG